MPQHYSLKTEVSKGEPCYYFPDQEWVCMAEKGKWIETECYAAGAIFENEKIFVYYGVKAIKFDGTRVLPENIASKTAFLEWQSRLIDCAKDQFKFKGNIEKMFGPENYSNWIPFYKEDISPSNAYMQGMGLIDLSAEEE